jgi:hypothetical protein
MKQLKSIADTCTGAGEYSKLGNKINELLFFDDEKE